MALIKDGKKVQLRTGYETPSITYAEYQQQKQERTARATPSITSQERTARTMEANARRGASASNTNAGPTMAQLQRQRQQAQVDLDVDTLNRVDSRMKELRAAQGKQTAGDRANDTLSGAVQDYGGVVVNTVGTMANAFNDPSSKRRQITRLQKRLADGGYSDGKRFVRDTEAQRKTIQGSIRRLADEAWQLERDSSFVNRTKRQADRMQDDSAASIASAKEGAGALGQLLVDVGVAGTQMGLDALSSALLAPIAGAKVAGKGVLAVRSFGGSAQEARRSGADLDQQLLYGAGSAGISVGTESMSNLAAPFRKIYGAGAAEKIAGSLVKRFGESGAVQMMRKLSQNAAGRIALSAIGEGGEEVVEDVLQPFLKRATYDPDAKFDAGEAGHDFLVGAILGGLGGVPEAVGSIGSKTARNQAETGAGAEVQAPAGVETAPAESGVEGVQSGTVEPLKVGRVTTIKRPYQGQKPVQAPKNAAAVQVDSGSVERARERINGAKEFAETPFGGGKFKTILMKSLEDTFRTAKGVEVSGVSFDGKPYSVDINKTVPGKVVSDPNLSAEKVALLDMLQDVVRSGEYVGSGEYEEHGSRKKPVIRYDYFETPVFINGQNYIAKFDIEVLPGANNYRTHQITRIDLAPQEARLTGPVPAPSSGTPSPFGDTSATSADSTIAQSSDSVKPLDVLEQETRRLYGKGAETAPDPLMLALFSAQERVDQATLTPEQFSQLAELSEQGTVGMDADGRVYQVDPAEHIDRRESGTVGRRNLNAFQYDHPELAGYYQEAARILLDDIDHTQRGGEIYSYQSANAYNGQGYARMKRMASLEVSELLDSGMSYDRIEKALDAIINDHGAENYADAKRVELLLDRMLTDGFQGVGGWVDLAPNEAYIREKGQIAGAVENEAGTGALDGIDEIGNDGLGAADAGSLNIDYDRLQTQSGEFHPQTGTAARPVNVPTTDFDGRNISQTAATVMGAKAIPDDVIPMIEQMVADGKLSYDPVTNAAAAARARAKIEQNGFDGAMEEYRSAVRAGKTSPEIEILGQTLLNNAANARDGQAIAELLSLYQAGGTNTAQAMQARRVMRKLSPEEQLYAITRSVYQIDGENIKVSQELIQKFLDQTDQAGRDAVMEEIVKDVAGQLPGSWKKIFDSIRYLAMLGNTRTHVRNLIGNAVFQPFTLVKNRLGGIGEAAAQRAGVDVERTKTATGVNPFRKPAREARAEYKDLADILNNSSHYNEDRTGTKAIREYYNPFKNVKHFQKLADALDWSLGRLGRKNMSLLEKEDSVFKSFIYGQTLADYLKANGVKSIDAASPKLLSKARNYAAQEALRNTFNDSNVVSDAVAKLGRARQSENPVVRGLGYAVEGTLPFKRTPANVAVRAVEYSPVGAGMSIIDLVSKGAKHEATPETVSKGIDRLAAGLSGSALGFLGFLLAKAGLVTGGDDEDEDQRNFDSLTGHQSYALETEGGTSYTLDWAAPASIPFFMGVELFNAWQDGKLSQDDLVQAIKNLGSPMLEMSMLQGLNDTFEEAAYAQRHDNSVLAALLTKAATGYFTQVFPTAGGQIERIGEDRRMTTYTDKNKDLSTDTQYTLGKISQKVPGWDYNQIPYIDAWGREEETGDVLSRILQNTISPGYLSKVNVNDVEQELQRVKDATGDSGVLPDRAPKYFDVDDQRKDLTAEEYLTYAKKRGQTALEVLGRMAESKGYKALDDEGKAQAVKYAYQYADAQGKMSVSSYRPGDSSIAAGVMKSLLPPETYILYRINSDRDGNGSTSAAEATQTLLELDGMTDKERGEAWSAFNNKGETEESRERKEAQNPFTGVLSKDYSPEEALGAWEIFNGKGTREEPYTREQKKKDLGEELGISQKAANDLYELMRRAANQ